ncbi:hypothetical protein ID866_9201, partial [Astraeus odoratus]
NVPLSAVPEDLTSFIREKDTWANKFGGFADVWKCALHREGKRETVRGSYFFGSQLMTKAKENSIG